MNLKPSLKIVVALKRKVIFILLGILSFSFISKNVLSDYSNDQLVEIVELSENGEEKSESDREEVKEELDDLTNYFNKLSLQYTAGTSYIIQHEVITWCKHKEVLSPPPDLG